MLVLLERTCSWKVNTVVGLHELLFLPQILRCARVTHFPSAESVPVSSRELPCRTFSVTVFAPDWIIPDSFSPDVLSLGLGIYVTLVKSARSRCRETGVHTKMYNSPHIDYCEPHLIKVTDHEV